MKMIKEKNVLGECDVPYVETELLDEFHIARAAELIRRGGIVAFPTETVYGLGGSALDEAVAAKIYAAKGRPSDNPLIVHLADPAEAERYADTCPLYEALAERFMPGPLTVILPKRSCIPDAVTGGLPTVALRVPVDRIAHELIAQAGVPIAAPSANRSGRPSTTTAAHCVTDLMGRVDAILDGGPCIFGVESTIVKIGEDGESLRLLRPGIVTPEDLQQVCRQLYVDPAVLRQVTTDAPPEAPGMKYRHYAPEAEVIILDGDDRAVYTFLKDKKNCGILCYEEDRELLARPNAYSMGGKNNSREQAHRLFACLRDFSGVGRIYARMPSREGIGMAVFNRLIKAAGYSVLQLSGESSEVK